MDIAQLSASESYRKKINLHATDSLSHVKSLTQKPVLIDARLIIHLLHHVK